jgi:hypothetical protein
MKEQYKNILLFLATLFICFLIIEAFYRIFDPFPYIPKWERNKSEQGLLTQYDKLLGWKGIPGARARFITRDSRIWVKNNSQGFRDIEHKDPPEGKEAIVFLGDSFAWGYAVDFDKSVVEHIRKRLPEHEVYNLAYKGYGTDQSLLAFRQWKSDMPLDTVVLMFYENDLDDNVQSFKYSKQKPRFILEGKKLRLTNVPVPKDAQVRKPTVPSAGRYAGIKRFLTNLIPHSIHDIAFRLYDTFYTKRRARASGGRPLSTFERLKQDNGMYDTAKALLKQLNKEVSERGGELLVVAIPQRSEFTRENKDIPYQLAVEGICSDLDIPYLDLVPALKKAFFRTYYRKLAHWNDYGHKVASDAIYEFLRKRSK